MKNRNNIGKLFYIGDKGKELSSYNFKVISLIYLVDSIMFLISRIKVYRRKYEVKFIGVINLVWENLCDISQMYRFGDMIGDIVFSS